MKIFILDPNPALFVWVSIDHFEFGLRKKFKSHSLVRERIIKLSYFPSKHIAPIWRVAVKLAKFLVTLLSLHCCLILTGPVSGEEVNPGQAPAPGQGSLV